MDNTVNLWSIIMRRHCDRMVENYTPEDAMGRLKNIHFMRTDEMYSLLEEHICEYPEDLWEEWRYQTGMLKMGDIPTRPIFSWKTLCRIITHYPINFIIFAMNYLDRSNMALNEIANACISHYNLEEVKVVLRIVFWDCKEPLPVTKEVIGEIMSYHQWEEVINPLLDHVQDINKSEILSTVARECVQIDRILFVASKLELRLDELKNDDELLSYLVEGKNIPVINYFVERIALPRQKAFNLAAEKNDVTLMDTIANGKVYEEEDPLEVDDILTNAVNKNHHETIYYILRNFSVETTRNMVVAIIHSERTTQNLIVSHLGFGDVASAFSLNDGLSFLRSNLAWSSRTQFVLRLVVRKIEEDPTKATSLGPVLVRHLKGHNRTTKEEIMDLSKHVWSAEMILYLAVALPVEISIDLFRKYSLRLPFTFWRLLPAGSDLLKLYLVFWSIPDYLRVESSVKDFMKRIVNVTGVFRQFCPGRIRSLTYAVPPSLSTYTLRTGMVVDIWVYRLRLRHKKDTTFPLLYRLHEAHIGRVTREISSKSGESKYTIKAAISRHNFSSFFDCLEGEGVSETNSMRRYRSFSLIQKVHCSQKDVLKTDDLVDKTDEEKRKMATEIEREACQWIGALPRFPCILFQDKENHNLNSLRTFTVIIPKRKTE